MVQESFFSKKNRKQQNIKNFFFLPEKCVGLGFSSFGADTPHPPTMQFLQTLVKTCVLGEATKITAAYLGCLL